MKTNIQNWKQVSISGVTGILMGAGAMKGMQVIQSKDSDEVANGEKLASSENSYDDMSFREAFEAARAELGAGGVFRWHGNIYNTYTADEWDANTADEQDAFAEQVGAEVSADKVETAELTQVEAKEDETDADVRVVSSNEKDATVSSVGEQTVESNDDDVRVLGYGEVTLKDGHNVTVQELEINGRRVAVVDVDQDGEADYAMADLNQNQQMDEGEVIDLHTGEAVSFTNDNNDDVAMTSGTFDL